MLREAQDLLIIVDASKEIWVRFQRKAKTFDTNDSRVVPHRSTECAQGCLTSEFGWDPVLPPWFDRQMEGIGGILHKF